MNQEETSQFFECLGEIWRDITAIEFLMRCAIAKKDGEIDRFPQPPYIKERVYKNYPDSFSSYGFEEILNKFNQRFPKIGLPKEVVELRHAMAHGIIAEIDKNETSQLVKFKEIKDKKELRVEFGMTLEIKRIAQIRQSLKEFRRYIMQEIDEK